MKILGIVAGAAVALVVAGLTSDRGWMLIAAIVLFVVAGVISLVYGFAK